MRGGTTASNNTSNGNDDTTTSQPVISATLQKMKFMQNKKEAEYREELQRQMEESIRQSHWVAKGADDATTTLASASESEVIGFKSVGRMSFGKFNQKVDKLNSDRSNLLAERKAYIENNSNNSNSKSITTSESSTSTTTTTTKTKTESTPTIKVGESSSTVPKTNTKSQQPQKQNNNNNNNKKNNSFKDQDFTSLSKNFIDNVLKQENGNNKRKNENNNNEDKNSLQSNKKKSKR